MAINFPNTPIDGNTYDYGGIRYTYADTGGGNGYWRVTTPGTVGIASSAEINTGTDLIKYVTAKEFAGSQYPTDIASKLASSSFTASAILTMLKTVDGAASGLDADLLDAQSSAFYRDAANMNAGLLPAARLPVPTTGAMGGHKKGSLSTATNGYFRDNESGLYIQWGYKSISQSMGGWTSIGAMTFPVAFPTECRSLTFTFEKEGGASYGCTFHPTAVAVGGSGTIYCCDTGSSGTRTGKLWWIAVGY